ncbi:MAG: hypothetical protein ABSE17_00005, partial [Candidatus Levyibacteriota bacterium]
KACVVRGLIALGILNVRVGAFVTKVHQLQILHWSVGDVKILWANPPVTRLGVLIIIMNANNVSILTCSRK